MDTNPSIGTPAAASTPVAFDNTIGALLIGVLVAYTLMGTVIVQSYNYYQKFPNDVLWLKSLVALVVLLEVSQTISIGHVLYFFTVKNFLNPAALLTPPKSFGYDPLVTMLVKAAVQFFFLMRIYLLTRKMILTCAGALLMFLALILGFVVTVHALAMSSIPSFEAKVTWLLPVSMAVSVAADLYIAITLVYCLYRQRNRGMQTTARVLDKIITWSIQTGTITSIIGILPVFLFVAMPNNFIWTGFYIVLPKLYSNSLLASLNGRLTLRDMRGDIIEMGSETLGGHYTADITTVSPPTGKAYNLSLNPSATGSGQTSQPTENELIEDNNISDGQKNSYITAAEVTD